MFKGLTVLPGAGSISLRHENGNNEKAILLIHGFGDTPQSLRYMAEYFHARGYDVRVPLLQGHGRTISSFNLARHDIWIDEAMAELVEMRAIYGWVGLGGLSMGGAISAILAARTYRLGALALLAPYVDTTPKVYWASRFYKLLELVIRRPVRETSELSILDPAERIQNLAYGAVTPRSIYELSRIAQIAKESLSKIKAPTIYIQSVFDNRISVKAAKESFDRLTMERKKLVLTEEGGHVITVDYGRQRVFDEVYNWYEFERARHILPRA